MKRDAFDKLIIRDFYTIFTSMMIFYCLFVIALSNWKLYNERRLYLKKDTKDTIQWHPAFQASIQIEFEAEAEKLTFEPEHLLSKKPMQMNELTITFICNHFPRKMVQHLKEFRGLDILHVEAGIYYITGDAFPIQLLVTKELDPKKISGCRVCAITCLNPRKLKYFSTNMRQKIIEIISSCNGSYYPGKLGCSKGG